MRLRAPPEDRGVLTQPALAEAGRLLEGNQHILERPDILILGRPLTELRRESGAAAVSAARAYLREACEPIPEGDSDVLFVSGHQPELFHPGVWAKNFALAGLARRHGALALNLIIDSDAPRFTTLRIPAWQPAEGPASPPHAKLIRVPFDYWHGEIPYEERPVQNEDLFASFAQRAGALTQNWPFGSMLPTFWDEIMLQARRTPLLGERFAGARRQFERRWGCHNLEVPLSKLMDTGPAGHFICHVLANLERFRAIYNDVLHSYRLRHGLRSRNHPVPDLAQEGDWLEAPFWGWQAGERRRRRLFVRISGNTIEIQAGDQAWPPLPLHEPLAGWQKAGKSELKIRTRALTTTMYARLFLADLFIHGIGGGIYDEVTDEVIRRFYGIEPPSFLTVSATLLLPLPRSAADEDACRALAHTLRDYRWNPERHLGDATPADWGEAKSTWIRRACHSRAERRQRCQAIRTLSGRLQPFLQERTRWLETRLQTCRAEAAVNHVLGRRDFAFCLYPEGVLQEFLGGFLRDA